MVKENTNKYDDMIHMDYRGVRQHPKMPMNRRAAQFSKFAALGDGSEDAETKADCLPGNDLPAQADDGSFSR